MDLKTLKKYSATFIISMQSTMEYRMDFLLSLVSGFFAIIIQYFLWTAIFSSSTSAEVFGYHYNQMIVYIILAGILSKVMATGFEWEISADIKNGGLSRFLVQPIKYLPYRMMKFFGQKLMQLLMVSIISVIFFCAIGMNTETVFDAKLIILLLPAVILSLLMNCLLFYCFSSLAFWITEVWAVFVGLGVVSNILSGGIFPLDVFGSKIQAVFNFLPFQYIIYFPLNILCGKLSTSDIRYGIMIQCIWVFVLSVLSKLLWKMGMKKYIAVGG